MAEAKASVWAYIFKSAMVRGIMLGVILFATMRDLSLKWHGVEAYTKSTTADLATRNGHWSTLPVAIVWLLFIAYHVRADYLASKEGDA